MLLVCFDFFFGVVLMKYFGFVFVVLLVISGCVSFFL